MVQCSKPLTCAGAALDWSLRSGSAYGVRPAVERAFSGWTGSHGRSASASAVRVDAHVGLDAWMDITRCGQQENSRTTAKASGSVAGVHRRSATAADPNSPAVSALVEDHVVLTGAESLVTACGRMNGRELDRGCNREGSYRITLGSRVWGKTHAGDTNLTPR